MRRSDHLSARSRQQRLCTDHAIQHGESASGRLPLGAKAREAGGKRIHVDPRFTRTSAMADVYIAIRAGSDIAFLGGIINYLMERDLWFHEYVLRFTNAATIVGISYIDADEDDGLFAGFDPSTSRYDAEGRECGGTMCGWGRKARAGYDPAPSPMSLSGSAPPSLALHSGGGRADLRMLFPPKVIRVAELLTRNSGRERTSSIVYALGWTQHSTGVQMIGAAATIQLLVGNIGRPGGGSWR